ncbi:MAG: hypothetical protein AAGD08_04690 [Pseudomonadota bacterium]
MTRNKLSAATALALTLGIGVAPGATAQQTIESGATVTGPAGETTEIRRTVTRDGGQLDGSVSRQRSDGRGFQRNWTQRRENGTVSREGSATTNQGRTWNRRSERSCADGACTGRSTVTGPNGGTWDREANWQRTGKGQWEGTVTRTGPKGRTSTSKRWFQIKPRN